MLTVEKGQGLAQPGYADGKMTALAAQWKASRKSLGLSDGWAMFYINANFDWNFYRLHTEMLSQPSWSIQMDGGEEGKPCLKRGDISFPQPEEGMLCFNHSIDKCREAFIGQCVNATTTLGFDGCFIDSAGFSTHPTQVTKRNFIRRCNSSASAFGAVQAGGIKMLVDLQASVGSDKLIIAKDSFVGGGEEYVNAVMPMDTFCSCYDCVWSDKKQGGTYAEICQTQIQLAIKLGNRGQVSILHGQVNEQLKGDEAALAEDFTFSLASFLIAASDTAFFGYSDGWYYNGTTWHSEYDLPLGSPKGIAKQGSGVHNMTWSRSFESATVEVDVAEHTSAIHWHASD